MKRKATILFALVAAMLAVVGVARAITFGQLDTKNDYPYVGAMVADFDGEKDILCSGTLISPTVFLTASHCTAYLESIGTAPHDVWVTFDGTFDQSSPLLRGTYHTNPLYGTPAHSDPADIAVIVLDAPVSGITPARLPGPNYLETIPLKNQRFTAVGYGTVREVKQKGGQTLFFDGQRRFADQGFRSLTKSWLNLSMNPSVGSGGTCYGDSGGPHFLGRSNLVVGITITGDRWCRATDETYRTDTAAARTFLRDYVTLPN
jgi:secreted trypsin-like serine protease